MHAFSSSWFILEVVGDRMLLTVHRQDAEKEGDFAGVPFFLLNYLNSL